MGLLIKTVDPNGPIPRDTTLTLSCDGERCPSAFNALFAHADGFVAQYHDAMVAGWKDTHSRGGRVFLCPNCSGEKRFVSEDTSRRATA